MQRSFYHFVLLGLLVVSSLAGSSFHLGSTAAATASEPQFSAAAATLIEQSGQIGQVYMSATPAYCMQVTAAYIGYHEAVSIRSYPTPYPSNPIGITASPGRSSQRVMVQTRLYQRLANGSYQNLGSYPNEVVGYVETDPQEVQPVGFFVNLPAGPDYVLAHDITWYALDGVTVQGRAVAIKSEYIHMVDGVQAYEDRALCDSRFPSTVALSATTGTVNSPLNY
jgi:hypothetical protein